MINLITVEKIKLLLPDAVLVALTDDAERNEINEELINEIIADGYKFAGSVAKNVSDDLKDEIVKNYVLAYLYAYAGLDEKASRFQAVYENLIKSVGMDKGVGIAGAGVGVRVSSNPRQFTDDELRKW